MQLSSPTQQVSSSTVNPYYHPISSITLLHSQLLPYSIALAIFKMSIAPPEFLPVLLGHGCFLKDEYGHVRLDSNGSPPYHLIPSSDNFLYMRPSKQAQQFWPADPAQKIPNGTSIVLLSVAVNTLCMRPDLITEIGITMYDTASIYDGVKSTKKKTPGCIAPGPRGEDITKFARSRHFIVQDTAYHHPETCHEQCHTAQPYSFTYRKSEFIPRAQILERIEQAFFRASCEGLSSVSYYSEVVCLTIVATPNKMARAIIYLCLRGSCHFITFND